MIWTRSNSPATTLALTLVHLVIQPSLAIQPESQPFNAPSAPVPILSINPNHPSDDDLAPILKAIGDARIVVLATATDGDGASHFARARLAQTLMTELGFSVIAYEAGFYDARAMNAQFAAGTDASLCPAIGLPQQLAQSGYLETLHRFVWKSYFRPQPVEVCGYDYRFTGARTNRQLPRDLLEYLGNLDPHPLTKDQRKQYLTVLERLNDAKKNDDDPGIVTSWQETHELQRVLRANREPLVEASGESLYQVWDQILIDMILNAEDDLAFEPSEPTPMGDLARQRHMGLRLVWMANTLYPDRRIIVFASTLAAITKPDTIQVEPDPELLQGYQSAAQIWHDAFGDDLYTIAFTAERGISGWIKGPGFPVPNAPTGSVESRLGLDNGPFAFVSLRNNTDPWWQRQRPSTMLGLNRALELHDALPRTQRVSAVWPEQVDAIFFIEQMFPNHWQAKTPEGVPHTVNIE